MRILSLRLEGFGPFKRRQKVDFDQASAGGMLLISGPTGSGKSSLLDAVSFALYGAVPRYDGQPSRVRSDHLAPEEITEVSLEFEISGRRFRVERRPEWQRPKRRGAGTTLQKAEARLWEFDPASEEWEGVAARPTDVAAELAAVIGLDHVQFLQVVLLAQGGFQRFLHADDGERQATLRTLFRTERFEQIEQLLVERRQLLGREAERTAQRADDLLAALEEALKEGNDEARAALSAESDDEGEIEPHETHTRPETSTNLSPSITDRREWAETAISQLAEDARVLRARAIEADALRDATDVQVQHTRLVASRQERYAQAEREFQTLIQQASHIEALQESLAAATRAAAVRGELEIHAEAVARRETRAGERTAASTHLAQALAELRSPSDSLDASFSLLQRVEGHPAVTELQQARDAITASLTSLDDVLSDEAGLTPQEAELRDAGDALAAATRECERLQARRDQIPHNLEEARAQLSKDLEVAALVNERVGVVERARAALEAAERVETLSPQLREAQEISLIHATEFSDAVETVRRLMMQRMSSMAGEIAEQLEYGKPCPVCGSREHPDRATYSQRVTDEHLDYAEANERQAMERRDAAVETERALATELAALRARTEGAGVEAARETLLEAETAHAAAQSATEQVQNLREDVGALEAELERIAEEERTARDSRKELEHRVQSLQNEITATRERVQAARGDYDTVAARREAELALRTRLETLIAATDALRTAEEAQADAATRLNRMLTAQGFDDASTAQAAALTEAERSEVEGRISDFDRARTRLRATLDDPELQNLPADPVPLEAHESAHREATERATRAQVVASTIERSANAGLRRLAAADEAITTAQEQAARVLRLRRLVDTVQGKDPNTRKMRLEVFVLAARLEAIIAAANRRLDRMVGGRYQLEHDDDLRSRGRQSGLGLRVMDAYTGRARTPASLSGGETFLASLALALGLADVVSAEAGGISLDTLFIDEGFGTLDPDALEEAMTMLDGLREGGRSVILISHVAELKERIPARLDVSVDGTGISTLRGAGVREEKSA